VLLSWCDSRVTQRRAVFQTLRKGVLLTYHMLPGTDGGSSPVWDAIGYPGPLGPPEDPPPKALQPLTIDADTELECDVCVVGSGAAAALPPACWPPPGSTWWCSRRLASDLGLRPAGRDLGRPRPGGVRRVVLPHRLGRQPDDLDRVHRAHERHGAGR
jgi:hypothetical protein